MDFALQEDSSSSSNILSVVSHPSSVLWIQQLSSPPMEVEHVAQVLELWERTEGLIFTLTDNERDLEIYFEHNPGMSHVALNEGHVVGAVLCGHDGRRGYLHHLAVQTNFRTRGIGRSLVEHCLTALARCGITQCNLFVVDDHQAGRQFWTSEGWSEWPDIRLMSKHLSAER